LRDLALQPLVHAFEELATTLQHVSEGCVVRVEDLQFQVGEATPHDLFEDLFFLPI